MNEGIVPPADWQRLTKQLGLGVTLPSTDGFPPDPRPRRPAGVGGGLRWDAPLHSGSPAGRAGDSSHSRRLGRRRHLHRHRRRLLPGPAGYRAQRATGGSGPPGLEGRSRPGHRGDQGRGHQTARAGGRPTEAPSICEPPASDRSRALGVERIDLYQLHAPDPKVPSGGQCWRARRPPAAGKDPVDRALQRVGGPDPGGRGHRSDHQRAEPPEPILSRGAGRGRGGVLCRARDWISWRTARPAEGGSTTSCRPTRCFSRWRPGLV